LLGDLRASNQGKSTLRGEAITDLYLRPKKRKHAVELKTPPSQKKLKKEWTIPTLRKKKLGD